MVYTAALLMIHLYDKVTTIQMCTQTFIQTLNYMNGVHSSFINDSFIRHFSKYHPNVYTDIHSNTKLYEWCTQQLY